MTTRDIIASRLDEALFLEPAAFDEAILGIAHRFGGLAVVAYDRGRVIDVLMRDGLDREEAEEFFEFNTIGAWMGDATPVFIDTRPAE